MKQLTNNRMYAYLASLFFFSLLFIDRIESKNSQCCNSSASFIRLIPNYSRAFNYEAIFPSLFKRLDVNEYCFPSPNPNFIGIPVIGCLKPDIEAPITNPEILNILYEADSQCPFIGPNNFVFGQESPNCTAILPLLENQRLRGCPNGYITACFYDVKQGADENTTLNSTMLYNFTLGEATLASSAEPVASDICDALIIGFMPVLDGPSYCVGLGEQVETAYDPFMTQFDCSFYGDTVFNGALGGNISCYIQLSSLESCSLGSVKCLYVLQNKDV